MKSKINLTQILMLLGIIAIGFTACKKSEVEDVVSAEQIINSGAIGIASTSSIVGSTSLGDSIYAMGACNKGQIKTAVSNDLLLENIKTYLSANYPDYNFLKAFSISVKGSTTINRFVVAINFNDKPVALLFNLSGNFVKVLELREGKDLNRKGGHRPGGCFDNRDGKQRDSLSLNLLPQTIKAYLNANYSNDTLKAAFVNKDRSVIVISKNIKFYATAFKLNGTFIKRVELPKRLGKDKEISQSALPAAIPSYLNETYPNFVFKKAFSATHNGTIKGYLVIIDANLTKYAVLFNGDGVFVEVKSIR